MYYESHQQKGGMGLLVALMLSSILILSGCASTEVTEQTAEAEEVVVDTEASAEEEVSEADPYESFNRKIYVFNDTLDKYVAKPISDAYIWVTPQFVQTGVSNFFNNLKDINVLINDALQGKFLQSGEDTGRFLVNTTVGLGGLFDVATEIGLEKHEEDFAQTLAVWGVPQGPYLVLPVLGPTTSRGVPGGIFDAAANPITYTGIGVPVGMVGMLNARANAEGALSFIDEAALDPYVFTRESFLQHRKYLISDGKIELTEDALDLEDSFYDDDEEDLSEEEVVEVKETVIDEDVSEDAVDSVTDQAVESVQAEADDTKPVESGFKLQLSTDADIDTDTEDFDQASGSFDETLKSFDEASRSYQDASEKLENMENQ